MTLLFEIGSIILLVLGFGFVIFFHELGHFLAAKWVGIRVEQFAVGFGQAIFSWRKGIGIRAGSTQQEYRRRIEEHLDNKQTQELQSREPTGYTDEQMTRGADELGLGDTEYRLNWIPLGGYVKMLGQDDLKPGVGADDPRAYNRKSVGARMVVVSAGVIMNIILAAIGFMVVFLIGLKVPPAAVGGVMPDSPAQRAGVRAGDLIESFDGRLQKDFTKIALNVALVQENAAVPITVRRTVEGRPQDLTLQITPARPRGEDKGFLSLGVEAPHTLAAMNLADSGLDEKKLAQMLPPESRVLKPGDVITAINGTPVDVANAASLTPLRTQQSLEQAMRSVATFDTALQTSGGAPVVLTVKNGDGAVRQEPVQPHFEEPFSVGFSIAGMMPRATVAMVMEESTALGKLQPGDAVAKVTVRQQSGHQDSWDNPSPDKLKEWLSNAAKSDATVGLRVIRNGVPVDVDGLKATVKVGEGQRGLGVQLGLDELHPVVADLIPGSPAADAGITPGATLTSVAGHPIRNWYDIQNALAGVNFDTAISVGISLPGVGNKDLPLKLSPSQLASVQANRYQTSAATTLKEMNILRYTGSPAVAMKWGVEETRDFILQFYLTLRRMFGGSVSPSNMMGPVGIFVGGARFAFKGIDWLVWFLSVISANLAVVNFLPIPIVDGGLFTFLLLEKIQGRPLSPRTMAIAQYVGLAFLVGVFVFVTYHDITRWL